eukprot:GILK01007421.1.p1 GENE.GILK01007421.1~~GILK01007421.1.p1  ORF type:complete len:786 (+),score=113.85 GILK01007421.1:172-2529(+)
MYTAERIIFLIGCSLSILGGIVVCASYFSSANMKRHPSVLLVYISVCDSIFSIGWLLNTVFPPDDDSSIPCAVYAAIAVFFNVGTLNWNFLLSLDILITLRRPLSDPSARMAWYHTFAWVTCTAIVCFVLADGDWGFGVHSNCGIKQGATSQWIFLTPIAIYILFAIWSSISILRNTSAGFAVHRKHRNSFLRRHFAIVVAFVAMWTWPAVLHTYSYYTTPEDSNHGYEALRVISSVCLSFQGFVIALIRLFERPIASVLFPWRSRSARIDSIMIQTDISEPLMHKQRRASSTVDPFRSYSFARSELEYDDHIQDQTTIQKLQTTRMLELYYSMLASLCYALKDRSQNYSNRSRSASQIKFEETAYSDVYSMRIPISLQDLPWATDINNQSETVGSAVSSPQNRITLNIYAPAVFKHMREKHGLSMERLIGSLQPFDNIESFLNSPNVAGGRSGSFFFRTFDNLYILKTINEREKTTFLETLLPSYHPHIVHSSSSLLARIYGCFTITVKHIRPIHFVLMENVCANATNNLIGIYDLKGSTVDRRVVSNNTVSIPTNLVLKDGDFEHQFGRLLLSSQTALTVYQQLHMDVEMLQKKNIMDYSLLICVCANFNNNSTTPKLSNASCPDNGPDDQMNRFSLNQTVTSVGGTSSQRSRSQSRSRDSSLDSVHTEYFSPCSSFHLASLDVMDRSLSSSVTSLQSTAKTTHMDSLRSYHSVDGRFTYHIGLIDMLQIYDTKKAIEHSIKILRYPVSRKSFSAIDSDSYAKRFLLKMRFVLGCDRLDDVIE